MGMRSIWMFFVIGLATGSISNKLLVSSETSPAVNHDLYLEGQPSGGFPSDDEDVEDMFSGSGLGDFSLGDIITGTTRLLASTPESPATIQEAPWNSTSTTERTEPTTMAQGTEPTTMAQGTEPTTMAQGTATTSHVLPEEEMETVVVSLRPTEHLFTQTTIESSTNPSSSETTAYNNTTSWDAVENYDMMHKERSKLKEGSHEVEAPEGVTSEGLWERTEVLAAVIVCGVVGFLCALFLILLLAYRMKKKDEGSYALGVAKLPPSASQKEPSQEFYA